MKQTLKMTVETNQPSLLSLAILSCVASLMLLVGCAAEGTASAPTAGATAEATEELPPIEEFEVPVKDPTAQKVVMVGSGIKPGSVEPGAVVTLAVRVRIGEPWHIYAIDKPTGVSKPTKLKLKLPAGVTAVGEWNIPEAHAHDQDGEEIFVYEKDAVFRHQVKVGADAAGLLDVGCEVQYQACKETSCMAPTSETTSVALEVKAP